MRITVAGGTGFIGRALVESLAGDGHVVSVLSRQGEPPVFRAAASLLWDGVSLGEWRTAVDGADAVVNLAGENIADRRWTRARKKALYDSRILSTRALVGAIAAARAKPKVLISASAVGYYGDRGGEELTEVSSAGTDFLATLCRDWEAEARNAETFGTRVALCRFGVVLARGGGALAKMSPPFRFFAGGPIGSGLQWMSWVHRDDVIGLVTRLLERDVSGPVNVVSPSPAVNRRFCEAVGKVLGRPSWLPVPALALRLALGELADVLLGGQKVIPKKALDAGYKFKHAELEGALRASLS